MGANKGARLESDLWECILILPNCNQTRMNIPNDKKNLPQIVVCLCLVEICNENYAKTL